MSVASKEKILIFCDYFEPGYKAGGPIKSIISIIKLLKSRFDFEMVTRNFDIGESKNKYNEKLTKEIQIKYNLKIHYLNNDELTFFRLKKIINHSNCHYLYLNSFFSLKFSVWIIFMKFLDLINDKKIILAPRGELSIHALKNKFFLKNIYIYVSNFFSFYSDVRFQVSNEKELKEVKDQFDHFQNNLDIRKTSDLSDFMFENPIERSDFKFNNQLRIVFISRITPIKNVIFSIELVEMLKIPYIFDIYGPINTDKDKEYILKFNEKIKTLNGKSKECISYCGELSPDEVVDKLRCYDVFLLPTKSENFGHIILESMFAGCIPLISDQTPWNQLEELKLGFIVTNSLHENYINKLLEINNLSHQDVLEYRNNIKIFLKNEFGDKKIIDSQFNLFKF